MELFTYMYVVFVVCSNNNYIDGCDEEYDVILLASLPVMLTSRIFNSILFVFSLMLFMFVGEKCFDL